jgi:hypothetical protein
MKKTWDWFRERLEAGDIVGGDIETVEDGTRCYRGPITSVSMEDGQVSIRCGWTAQQRDDGTWERVPTGGVGFSMKEVVPYDEGMGRIEISIPYLGTALIYPRGDKQLNPKDVVGMEASDA